MKKLLKLIILLIMLIPTLVSAKSSSFVKQEYGDYETAQRMVKELMKSYYIKGRNIQYNYAKADYPIGAPEDATSQDIMYSVCAAYTYSVHNQAFGMKYDSKSSYTQFPRYNYNISEQAYAYYKDKIETDSGMAKGDGTFLLYYQHALLGDHDSSCKLTNKNLSNNKIKYVYGDTNTDSAKGDLETLINNMRPGDLVVYSGHALIVYDIVINPNTGKKDALILNSTADEYIRTRIDGTSKLSYNLFKSPYGNNGALDVSEEGSIQFLWFTNMKQFVNSAGNLSCQTHECAVVRPFYENKNGKAVFNYSIDKEQYSKSLLRIKYPGLIIEKTVDKGDNNSINLGDELTYTIKITNKSGVDYNATKYSPFTIEEQLTSLVEYKSSDGSYKSGTNTIVWQIPSLANNATKTLKYTVKVKNKIENTDKEVLSTGKFYSPSNKEVYLATGTVKNLIIEKNLSPKTSFAVCYEKNKNNFKGLALVDAVYECAYGKKYKISFNNDFKFSNLFEKYTSDSPKVKSSIQIKENEKNFSEMILNNYYSGLVFKYSEAKNKDLYYIPRFFGNSSRAKTINPNDFKDGDVLIYYITDQTGTGNDATLKTTNEEGMYAYVYINGKFVGANGSYDKVNGIKNLRNEFVADYYGKEYARHASTSTCERNFKITSGTTCDYKYYLYNAYGKKGVDNSLLEFANYQTLYDKDYYVILRPSVSEITDISFTPPTKKKYIQNQGSLDLSGARITIMYDDNSTEAINLTDKEVKVSGFNNSKLGKNKITVQYEDYKTTFDVEIVSSQVEAIKINNLPTKTKYIKDYETLDLFGGELIATYKDDSTAKINLADQKIKVSGFDNSKLGKNKIIVEYEGQKTTFDVEIVSKKAASIKLSGKLSKQKYIQNSEVLDLTGVELIVKYDDESSDKVNLTNKKVKVSGFDNSELGKNKIIVEYEGQKTDFDVEIIPKKVTSIKLSKKPSKQKYTQGSETLDMTGGELIITYNDKSKDKISLTNDKVKVSGFDNSKLGKNKIIVEYEGQKTEFSVEIANFSEESESNILIFVGLGLLFLIILVVNFYTSKAEKKDFVYYNVNNYDWRN